MTESDTPLPQDRVTKAGRLMQIARVAGARLLLVWGLGVVVVLSLFHHTANFWEWSVGRQVAVAGISGMALASIGFVALAPLWELLGSISTRRWIAFCIPAVVISGVMSSQIMRAPETEHRLIIAPHLSSPQDEIPVREIRAAYGNTVDLNQFSAEAGWGLRDGLLVAQGAGTSPLELRFRGPVGEQVRVSFITGAQGGTASVDVDGRAVTIDLRGPEGNETRARLDTQYRWGALNPAFLPALALIDAVAIFLILAGIWAAHELSLTRLGALPQAAGSGVRRHAAGLMLICSASLLLHALSFVTVPLRVLKDSPSYLQGAVHLSQYGNLDGASPYRGLAFSLLFAPSFSLFGRNPLGVKLTLHLLALGCVPLAYAIGWALTGRRWVAIASGLVTALSPDLYAYSGDVLSEVPHIFSLLLLGAALINALRRYSFRALLACMLAGSLAVLVRPDNLAAFGVGALFLGLSAFSFRSSEDGIATSDAGIRRLRQLLIAGVIAALPLVAWSAHNLRVHGFFGISNYFGAVLYDGWIYYGENSGIRILDGESTAVREINATVPILVRSDDQPTGPILGQILIDHGYGGYEAFSLLGQAATDSIFRHPDRALRILILKLSKSLVPQATLPVSLAASDDENPYAELTREYFDPEPWLVPWRARVEAWGSSILPAVYGPFYSFWLALAGLSLWLGLYRRPPMIWLAYGVLIAVAVGVPLVVGLESWRYLIPSLILAGPMAFAAVDTLLRFLSSLISSGARGAAST